jgi:molecular chaperone DnaJ
VNPYEVLGLERGASASEIDAAWLRLAGQQHTGQRWQEIHAAYQILSDPGKRAAFDPEAMGAERGPAPASPGRRSPLIDDAAAAFGVVQELGKPAEARDRDRLRTGFAGARRFASFVADLVLGERDPQPEAASPPPSRPPPRMKKRASG